MGPGGGGAGGGVEVEVESPQQLRRTIVLQTVTSAPLPDDLMGSRLMKTFSLCKVKEGRRDAMFVSDSLMCFVELLQSWFSDRLLGNC